MAKTAVDLGCGKSRRNPSHADVCIGVDLFPSSEPDYFCCRLGIDPLPFADNTIDYFSAFDVVEHVPRVLWRDGNLVNPFIFLMSEVYRCLKPTGTFYAETPAFPHSTAFQDPTHVNIITEDTVFYFCRKLVADGSADAELLLEHGRNYGFDGVFNLVEQRWRGAHLLWTLAKSPL